MYIIAGFVAVKSQIQCANKVSVWLNQNPDDLLRILSLNIPCVSITMAPIIQSLGKWAVVVLALASNGKRFQLWCLLATIRCL